jgi:hypothetical protein
MFFFVLPVQMGRWRLGSAAGEQPQASSYPARQREKVKRAEHVVLHPLELDSCPTRRCCTGVLRTVFTTAICKIDALVTLN